MATSSHPIPLNIPSNFQTTTYVNTRLNVISHTTYAKIIERFHTLVPQLTGPLNQPNQAEFKAYVESTVGDHGFMKFFEIDHGAWLPLFPSSSSPDDKGPNSGRGLLRVMLGNPLVAITLMKESIVAGLNVPVEVLFIEEEDHVRCVFDLPSGLVSGEGSDQEENNNLMKAARILDGKLIKLIEDVMK